MEMASISGEPDGVKVVFLEGQSLPGTCADHFSSEVSLKLDPFRLEIHSFRHFVAFLRYHIQKLSFLQLINNFLIVSFQV
jgi:hypothetical protein